MSVVLRFLIYVLIVVISSHSHATLIKNQTLNIDGSDRTYDLFVPTKGHENKDDGPKPLVFLLHGHFGEAEVMIGGNGKKAPYKLWLSIAEREGWYLVIPDGEFGPDEHRGWNDCRADASTNPKSDDVRFVLSLIKKIASQYEIDQNRVYANGTSNGGNMAFRLAQESADKFKAIAAVVASMPENNKCEKPQQPISVLVMNGTKDPLLPYEGGAVGRGNDNKYGRGSVLSTDQTVEYWLKNNKISSNPTVESLPNKSRRDRSSVELIRYSGGESNTEVVLYKVIGGGHTEPSLTEHYGAIYKTIVGKQNKDIEMVNEVFKFFERNR